MNKFTIFTIILSVSVIVVTADLVLRDYYGDTGMASIFGSDEVSPVLSESDTSDDDLGSQQEAAMQPEQNDLVQTQTSVQPAATAADQQPEMVVAPPQSKISQNLIRQAGFNGNLAERQFSGKLYQLLDITKTPVDAVFLYDVQENGVAVVSITEIVLRDEIRALQLYSLLQNKTKPYIDLSLNETNAYGDRSFYINHARKSNEAFLTLKIGRSIYGFAYVKSYHPQLKMLIQLLNS